MHIFVHTSSDIVNEINQHPTEKKNKSTIKQLCEATGKSTFIKTVKMPTVWAKINSKSVQLRIANQEKATERVWRNIAGSYNFLFRYT